MLHENLLFYLLSSSTPVLYYLNSFIEIEGRVVSVVGGKNTGLGGGCFVARETNTHCVKSLNILVVLS